MIKKFYTLAFAVFATVAVACSDDNKENEPDVPPTPQPVEVESVEVNPSELNLRVGESATIEATVLPADADDATVVWTISAPEVASVSAEGVVTALIAGEAEITATAGNCKAVCKLTVVGPLVESVEITPNTVNLLVGEKATLVATVLPADAEDPTVTWVSSAPEVATVSAEGVVEALAAGEAVITATAGEVYAQCEVSVTQPVAEAKIGDYFYSDGTWSTELNDAKAVIGVIFWLGDPTESDAALRADHPECTHGLVVSLDQVKCAWQPEIDAYTKSVSSWVADNAPQYALPQSANSATAPIQKICGYNNTKAIEAFNAAAANVKWPVAPVAKAVAYRSEVPAPRTSSDWYIPSPKELSLLCAGDMEGNIIITNPINTVAEIINDRMGKLDAQLMNYWSYWSSTEGEGSNYQTAWNYCFDPTERKPLSLSYKDWSEYARVRYVLAF